jgi:hypothetical protein
MRLAQNINWRSTIAPYDVKANTAVRILVGIMGFIPRIKLKITF